MSRELADKIPEFKKDSGVKPGEEGFIDWSALTSVPTAKNGRELLIIIGVAVAVVAGIEVIVRVAQVPSYIFPAPSGIFNSLVQSFDVIWPHLLITLQELLTGYAIGAVIGILLAGVITQFPFIEKIVTPYII